MRGGLAAWLPPTATVPSGCPLHPESLASGASVGEQTRHRLRQACDVPRLSQENVNSGASRFRLAIAGREHNDRSLATMRQRARMTHDLDAARARQFVVEQQQVVLCIARDLSECVRAVG